MAYITNGDQAYNPASHLGNKNKPKGHSKLLQE